MNPVATDNLRERLAELEQIIAAHASALVAFSGGVDSSLALAVAARALPNDRVLAVTSNNENYLPSELDLARDFAESLAGAPVVTPHLDDLIREHPPIVATSGKIRSLRLKSSADEGAACVVDGANKDTKATIAQEKPQGTRGRLRGSQKPGLPSRGSSAGEYLGAAWDQTRARVPLEPFSTGQEITLKELSQVARAKSFCAGKASQGQGKAHGE